MQKRLRLSLFLLAAACLQAAAQDLTGIWRGYFLSGSGERYKYEVQLSQSKKSGLAGVTYSYLDTRFYGKAAASGQFTKATKAVFVQETRTVEVRMQAGSVACIMKCRLVYSRSGNEEVLEGVYASLYEKNDPAYGVKRGGDCGGGQVFLRKVPTSDFYVEPFVRKKMRPVTPEPPVAKATPKAPAKSNTPTVRNTKPPTTSPPAIKRPTDEVAVTRPPSTTVPPAVMPGTTVTRRIPATPPVIRNRQNELTKTFTVTHPEVEISLYDNGEIDNDTVSIYLNGALVLANKRLSNKPITYKIQLDENNPEQTLVMVAENLGTIPPNTSLMLVQDGDRRYQVSITSTEQKNAMVRFRYMKPGG